VSEPQHAITRRILVVDDEPTVRRFATRVLVEAGYIVEEAPDGAAALDRIVGARVSLDAVVSDIVMPRLNGVELLRALRATHPDLPVILMSGYGTEQLTGLGIASPCAILPKPFSGDRLIHEVRRCLADVDPLTMADANHG
jgi:two-component system cell cycle sensor histidine kinase/response regulator CckA